MAGQAGLVRAPVVGQGAAVAGPALAAHAAVADGTAQPGAELVAAAGPGGGHFGVADVAVPAAHLLGGVPGGHVDQGGVGGLGGPDPFAGRHPHLLAALAAAAADDLVPGVFGVGQDLIDQREGPAGRGAGGRVGDRVGGQPGPDGGLAQVLADAPLVDQGDDRRVDRVGDEPGFGAAFGGLGRDGVRVAFPGVAGRDLAEVPPGEGMFLQPVPHFVFELEPEPFGDTLLNAPDQDGGRVDPFDAERLVGGEYRDALILEFFFQFQRVVHAAGAALNFLTHHEREIRRRGFRLVQKIGDAAVAGDPGGGGHLPGVLVAPVFQVIPARFDVPVVGHDLAALGQPGVGVADLAAHRGDRVLKPLVGGAAQERHRDQLGGPGGGGEGLGDVCCGGGHLPNSFTSRPVRACAGGPSAVVPGSRRPGARPVPWLSARSLSLPCTGLSSRPAFPLSSDYMR